MTMVLVMVCHGQDGMVAMDMARMRWWPWLWPRCGRGQEGDAMMTMAMAWLW